MRIAKGTIATESDMATAIKGKGAVYDVKPAGEFAYGGPIGGIIGFITDTVRGSCSGLLALLGGTHITGTASAMTLPAGTESFVGLMEQLSVGGLTGPVEILGGAALFLTARRAIARTLGLLLFIGFAAAYANGYSVPEMLTALSDLLKRAAGLIDAIQRTNAV